MQYAKLATGLLILVSLKSTDSLGMKKTLKDTLFPFWIRDETRPTNRSQALQDVKGKTRAEEASQPSQTVREFLDKSAAQPSQPVKVETKTEPIQPQEEVLVQSKASTKDEFYFQQLRLLKEALATYEEPFDIADLLHAYAEHTKKEFPEGPNLSDINIYNRLLINQAKMSVEKAKELLKQRVALPFSKKSFQFNGQCNYSIRGQGTMQRDITNDVPSLETIQRNYIYACTNLDLTREILKPKNHRKSQEKTSKSENGKSCYN